MTEEDKFWTWFKNNNSIYFYLNQILDLNKKEKLLNKLLSRLHAYNENLFFEIGGLPNGEQELIITTGGNKEYFSNAEELVSKAPQIDQWKFMALKPAMGIQFVSNYEGLEIDPGHIWFLPLNNKSNPKTLGLRVCIQNYNPENETRFLNGIYQILDTLLGEKSAALDIQYVEIDQLPENPEKDGLIKLDELPEYIKWKKRKT